MSRPKKPEWLRQCVLEGKKYSFKTKTAWKHNLLNLSVLGGLLALIVGVIAAGARLEPLLYLPLAAPTLGFAFFCLYILVIHEASHGMFVLAKTRRQRVFWNRIFGWPVSLFFFTHYHKLWEVGHLEHHVRPIEDDDPQSLNRVTGPRLFMGIAALVLLPGFAFVQRIFLRSKLQQEGSSWWIPVVSTTLLVSTLALSWVTVGWWAALAIVWGLQLLSALNELKGALEHGGAIAHHPEPLLRSRTSLFPLRRLIMPLNISMHFEHHLNHTVPWYELMNYHRAIRPLVPKPLRENLFNRDLFNQVMGRIEAPQVHHGEVDVASALPVPAGLHESVPAGAE